MSLAVSGYIRPQVRIAPGQIVTLYISSTSNAIRDLRASSTPLPTSLGDLAISIRQDTTIPARLLSVSQGPICDPQKTGAGCSLAAVTIQVPFEIQLRSEPPLATEIVITQNGTESGAFIVGADNDHVHVITTCETQASLSDGSAFQFLPCTGLVTHADGTLISSKSPAKPGETIVVYAYGLGRTSPTVPTGDVSPSPAATIVNQNLAISFDFRPNAIPSRPYMAGASVSSDLKFAGLTPGQVGLYQLNVRIPDTIPSFAPCTGTGPAALFGYVESNLTINIGGISSFDGAAICVQAP
jgi:uncharacterized protein (TIGR03437 family)